jgi:hypothetical protein
MKLYNLEKLSELERKLHSLSPELSSGSAIDRLLLLPLSTVVLLRLLAGSNHEERGVVCECEELSTPRALALFTLLSSFAYSCRALDKSTQAAIATRFTLIRKSQSNDYRLDLNAKSHSTLDLK